MKSAAIQFASLILALFLAVFSIGYVFAWFAGPGATLSVNLTGSASAYFAGGDGSQNNPFLITNSQHIYNLAWLNNTGKFGTTKYYFKVEKEVDMSGIVLPPIGTHEYPFLGDFDGNSQVISNLQVSTDHNHITNAKAYNSGDTAYSTAVGMFGETASTATRVISSGTTTVDVSGADAESNVHDFILVDPKVEVSGTSSHYNTADTNNYYRAGIAVGYADGDVSNISIYDSSTSASPNTKLKVSSIGENHFKTINSIIGGVGDNVNDDDIIGADKLGENISLFIPSGISGSDNSEIETNNAFNISTWVVSANGYPVKSTGAARWINGTIEKKESLNHMGLGNFSFLSGVQSAGDMEIYSQFIDGFYYKKYTTTGTLTLPSSTNKDATYLGTDTTPWGGIILDKNSQGTVTAYTDSTMSDAFRYENESKGVGSNTITIVSENPKEITVTEATETAAAVTTGVLGTSTSTDYSDLMSNSLWFNITESTNAYLFIVVTSGGSGRNLYLSKVMTGAQVTAAMKAKAQAELTAEGLGADTITNTLANVDNKDFFFKNDYDILVGKSMPTTDLYTIPTDSYATENNKRVAYGYYIDLTVTNAGTGLYVLYAGSANIRLYYAEASGVAFGDTGNQGTSTALTKIVRRVDFIYDTATPIQYNVNNGYVHTNAIVTFTTSTSGATVILGFNRSTVTNSIYTLAVVYNGSAYTVTISQIPGTDSANYTTPSESSISFPDWGTSTASTTT